MVGSSSIGKHLYLVGVLSLLLTTASWSAPEGEDVCFSWSPSPAQIRIWLSGAPGAFPPGGPVVSLKACAVREGVTTLEVTREAWRPAEGQVSDLEALPTASLGARSSWRGVPYQEVLVRPLREGGAGGAEVLHELTLRLHFEGSERVRALPEGRAADLAAAFVNPGDLARLDSGPSADRARGEARDGAAPLGLLMPRFRVAVSEDGVFRMDRDYLLSHGFDPAGLDPRNMHLTSRGVEVPILVEGEGDGSFDSGDAVVFYGQKLAITDRDAWNGGDFTDTNIYWLTLDTRPGLRMTAVLAAPVSGHPEVLQFPCQLRLEENTILFNWYHIRPNRDLWFWGAFFGGTPGATRDFSVRVPNPASSGCQVTAWVGATSASAHEATLRLNGLLPSSGPTSMTWSGLTVGEGTFQFAAGLASGSNTLTLATGGSDYQIADRFEVLYQRTLEATAGSLLLTVPATPSLFRPYGFSTAPIILDLSDADAATGLSLPRLLTGAVFSDAPNPGTAAFEATGTRFALSSEPALPDAVELCTSRDLDLPSAGADLLVITHPDFHPTGLDPEWQAYLARRSAQMDVEVVDIQEIYDTFSEGLFDPAAIRSFLQATQVLWTMPPEYVLLVGDGTYDYKDYMHRVGVEPTYKNWVPTLMVEDLNDSTYLGRYPSDAWFGDLDGDGFPDLAVGRLPARTYAQFAGMLTKIMAYEDQALSGSWYKTHLYVGDTWDEAWEYEAFEVYNEWLRTTYSGAPWSWARIFYHGAPYNGTNAEACAADIRAAFPGAALLHFSGHSGFGFWSSHSIFTTSKVRSGNTASDIDLLATTDHLPFVVQSTCYTSAFSEATSTCLSEELVARAGKGAIGTAGASTIAYVTEEEDFATAFYGMALGRPKWRAVGDLVEAGRFAMSTADPRTVYNYVLLGDPSMRLVLPAPDPPGTLAATGAHQAVDLSWTAAPGAAGYLVDRSSDGGATWVRVTSTPLPQSQVTYRDSGLQNMTEYRYTVLSLDGEGFQGPPSQPASATPSNPDPPAVPTGLTVTDPGLDTVLDISWAPNAESDLQAYTLARGTAPGAYDHFTDFPKGTAGTRVGGLQTGTTYYFALKARNTSGRESAYCPERPGTPTGLRLAVHPPAPIADLRMAREDKSLRLTWTRPGTDPAGAPVTVVGYTLYRVQGLYDWNLEQVGSYSAYDLVAQITDPDQTWYLDEGAWNLPSPLTYLVVAWSDDGYASAASVPAPGAITALRAWRSPATGATLLSFPPVTATVAGTPCTVDRYEVYGFYPVLLPDDHVAPAPGRTALTAQLLASLPPCEAGAVLCDTVTSPPLFYTVVAVDRRGNRSLF